MTVEGNKLRSTVMPSRVRALVLVVDDEELVGRAIQRILRSEHVVEWVSSASEALERLAREPPIDAILCDLMMPEMTGMDFSLALASVRPAFESRVIFMTGGAFTDGARVFLEERPNSSLEKPLEPEEVRRAIGELISRSRVS